MNVYLHVYIGNTYMHVWYPCSSEDGKVFLGCELSCGFWKSYPGPLWDQHVL